jgi:hypothetical protein
MNLYFRRFDDLEFGHPLNILRRGSMDPCGGELASPNGCPIHLEAPEPRLIPQRLARSLRYKCTPEIDPVKDYSSLHDTAHKTAQRFGQKN